MLFRSVLIGSGAALVIAYTIRFLTIGLGGIASGFGRASPSLDDAARVLELMRSAKVPTIGIAMGDYGTLTRILATRYGAPFTYCVFNVDRRVAPGQMSFYDMKHTYRVDTITSKTKLFGVVADPVAHSYSPMLHNGAFDVNQLDYRYLPFQIGRAHV